MYLLPVNVAVNFNEIRLISSFDPSIRESAELLIPLGPKVPIELIINACRVIVFPEHYVNDQVITTNVLASLINSYIFCKTTRANTNETTEKVLRDIVDALQRLYDYKESGGEWTVVRRVKTTAKGWIDRELKLFFTGKRKNGNIIRNVLPYFFIKGIPYEWDTENRDIFLKQMAQWINKVGDEGRKSTLRGMVLNYSSYF